MVKYKNKIIAGVIIAVALVFAFVWGGDAPGRNSPESQTDTVTEEVKSENKVLIPPVDREVKTEAAPEDEPASHPPETAVEEKETEPKDKYHTDPVPEGKPVPIEPESAVISHKELSCTLSVRCDTAIENIGWLDEEKVDLVPKDGVIYAEQTVIFYEGESVFNVLLREMKRNKIHMEFENTPIYNSAYIEGIANLYEFDCGELSGWMYKVNNWFPNYGCSRYRLKDGDKIEWLYTCDWGRDVGSSYDGKAKLQMGE